MVKGGELVYVRDGKVFKSLSKAVGGNADAERAAHKYAQQLASGKRWSYWYFPAMAAMTAATFTSDIYTTTPESWENEILSNVLVMAAGGMLIIAILGVRKRLDSETHIHDAINIFNAGVNRADLPSEPTADTSLRGASVPLRDTKPSDAQLSHFGLRNKLVEVVQP